MLYAAIHHPLNMPNTVSVVCKKYYPNYELVGPHVTCVFPFTTTAIDKQTLIEHLNSVASVVKAFEVRFNELELSWDQWLFLTPSTGRKELIEFHNALYAGVLRQHLREDIPFVPHIAIGQFQAAAYNVVDPKHVPLDEVTYQQARAEVEEMKIDFSYEFKEFELIELADDLSAVEVLQTFSLAY